MQKAGPVAGTLVRRVIAYLRRQGVVLPLQKPIWVAVSGGSDSVALGHLLVRFGRRIIAPELIRWVHVNHGVRQESEQEARFVKELGQQLGVLVRVDCLKASQSEKAEVDCKGGWEAFLREHRRRVFLDVMAQEPGSSVWTAHHQDDQAETVLWRILTGCLKTHGKGIHFAARGIVRPLLNVRKQMLKNYLQEVGVGYCEDGTNFNDRYLRSRMRMQLFPIVESLFPKAVEHLANIADEGGVSCASSEQNMQQFVALLADLGIRPRRAQIKSFAQVLGKKQQEGCRIDLAQGWALVKSGQIDLKA